MVSSLLRQLSLADLKRGKYFVIKVAPGRHMIIGEDGTPSVIDAHSGEEYFVRLERGFVVGPSGRTDLFQATTILPTDAKKELNYLSYIEGDRIHSVSVSKKDPTVLSRPELKKRPEDGNSESK